MTVPVLETPRLHIRPFAERDLGAFVAYRNDEDVARYQGWSLPYTLEQARSYFQEMEQQTELLPDTWRQLAIERQVDQVLIGDCAIKLSRDSRQAEIGCTLAQAYWNTGYALEATRRLLAYLFDDLHVHRVTANCDVENPAAARTLEKAGLRREAHLVENLWFKGRWSSEYWYAILASEWIS